MCERQELPSPAEFRAAIVVILCIVGAVVTVAISVAVS